MTKAAGIIAWWSMPTRQTTTCRAIVSTLRRLAPAATDWMNDRPFQTYLFIYHFPRGPAGGGMEHAYSTAIDISANRLADNPLSLGDLTAHEFFHLWNVKRIRPQSLEPIDYTKENYTRALWFSEGVTSTAGNIIQLRAGLLDEAGISRALADEIGELERRPAHLTQSAEESSLDAWLEKYDYYRLPDAQHFLLQQGESARRVARSASARGQSTIRPRCEMFSNG